MTRADFRSRWQATCETLRECGAHVDGAQLLDRVLADFDALVASEADEILTLDQAAGECGYTRDHLGRLVREGGLPNAGRPHAPRLRRADLPRKASDLRSPRSRPQLVGADPEQIARSIVTPQK
jgi:hypothetical protein